MKIGRMTKEITDFDREENLSDVKEKRKLMISIFYTVDPQWQKDQKPSYLDLFSPHVDGAIQVFKGIGVEENFLLNHVTDCYNDAPLSATNENSPIIIYSPGMGVDRDMYLFNIKQLVLAGYIVITVGATYESLFTIFPGKEIVYQSDIVRNILGTDFISLKSLIDIRVDDITYVINTLSNLNKSDSFFKGMFNLNRIGVIGHSLGGTTIYELAKNDERIKAGILLDGSLHLISNEKCTDTPFLSIRQHHSSYCQMKEIWNGEAAQVFSKGQQSLFDSLSGVKYFMKVKDSNHMSFSDVPIIFRKKDDNNEEMISKIHQTINIITVAFFNEFLKSESFEFTKMITHKSRGNDFYMIDREGEIIN